MEEELTDKTQNKPKSEKNKVIKKLHPPTSTRCTREGMNKTTCRKTEGEEYYLIEKGNWVMVVFLLSLLSVRLTIHRGQ